jgi:hypothetical protein
VSEHVAPHRWADLWAGRVDAVERATMERHVARCRACAKVRQRVTRASDSFSAIRAQSAPEVSWDAIRAKVHWSVSTERQAALRQRRPAYGWLAAATAAGIAVGLVTGVLTRNDPLSPPRAPVVARPATPTSPAAPPPATDAQPRPALLAGLVSRTAGDVMVDGVRPANLFGQRLTEHSALATADGRVDVQFGADSAFALGPMSTVQLRRFDARSVELAVDGTLDVVVAPRSDGQRFIVVAGDQLVEVRGTQFRVVHDAAGTTIVACHRGRVSVSDRSGQLELAAAQRLVVAAGHTVSEVRPAAMSADELAALAPAPLALAVWGTPAVDSSIPLEIASTGGRRGVRVDGIELGAAPLRVRVMPGRHSVEAADSAGRFRRAGWVDVAATGRPARFEVPAELPATGGGTERQHQFRAGIDQSRLRGCTRSIAKAGLTGTYVQIEISVDAQGALGFLNVLDTDLPSATASCVREVLVDVRFRSGAAASWQERIDL